MIENATLTKISDFVIQKRSYNFDNPKRKGNCDFYEHSFCVYKDETNPEIYVVISTEDCFIDDKIDKKTLNGYVFDKNGNNIEYDITKLDLNWIKRNCKTIQEL